MKISDITDYFIRSPLFEMSYERRKATDLISGKSFPIAHHLIKCFLMPTHQSYNHWKKELNNYFSEINDIKLKPNGKKLSASTYYELLWEEPFGDNLEMVENQRENAINEYANVTFSELSNSEIYAKIEKIIHTISYDIANKKYKHFKYYLP